MNFLIFTLVFSFTFSFLFLNKFIPFLQNKNILDIPNHRSAHILPTPRGAGWAIIISQFTIWGLFALFFDFEALESQMSILVLASCLLVYISFKDDLKSVTPTLRFICQFVSASMIILSFSSDTTFLQSLFPFWLDRALILFFFIGWINIFNFMDGIDGISAQQVILMCIISGIVFYSLNYLLLAGMSYNMAAAALGFLLWNWHPARIFLGDVGSVFIGLFTGWLILHFLNLGEWQIALLLPGFYYLDGGLTLVKRALQKKNIFKPHQEHFYQMPVHQNVPASTTCLWIILGNLSVSGFVLLGFFQNELYYLLTLPTLIFLLLRLKTLK